MADAIILFCYHYDPSAAKYSLAILKVVKVAGILTVASIASLVLFLSRRDRRPPSDPETAVATANGPQ
jgi:hypothetical protein